MNLRELKYKWYDIKYGITNIIKWFPVIWKDRNWDSVYTFKILIKKLELQRDSLKKNDRFIGVDDVINEMNYSINLLKKVNDDWNSYEKEFFEKHEAKWGAQNLSFKKIIDGSKYSGLFELVDERAAKFTEEENKQENAEFLTGMIEVKENRLNDLKKALNNIAEKSDAWWD